MRPTQAALSTRVVGSGIDAELADQVILRRVGELDLGLRRAAGRLRERVDVPAGRDLGRDHQHGGPVGGRGGELGRERDGIGERRIAFESGERAATRATQLVAQANLAPAPVRSRTSTAATISRKTEIERMGRILP